MRIPSSTYRFQFNRSFSFSDACRLIPYLDALGMTDCYCSSYLKAVPGSEHGYDMVDPTAFNPEVGTEEEYQEFAQALRSHRMGQLLDVVANHMGIGKSSNAWWLDVLENGPSSSYSSFFDIDWRPVKGELKDKVLLPILGDQYGVVLENQEIRLAYEDGTFFIRYYDHQLPIAPRSYSRILSHRVDSLLETHRSADPYLQELQSIITALNYLPPRSEQDAQRMIERYREKEIIKKRLATLARDSPMIAAFLEENLRQFNGKRGDSKSFDLLDALLDNQAYRLASWQVAAEEINYRRFFDINELAGIRMEEPAVFERVHPLIFRLLAEGSVTGLRIDHVDGLYAPKDYLQKLQGWVRANLPSEGSSTKPLYIIVEKILGLGETLPDEWPVYGTTGYDFLNLINGLFVDRVGERSFDNLYARFIGKRLSFEDLIYEKKRLIMEASMASEINVLGHQLNLLSEKNRRARDFTLNSLTHAIREIIACFSVYRTYVTGNPEEVTERDRAYIRLAVARAKRRNPAVRGLVFDFVKDLLLLKYAEHLSEEDRQAQHRFVMKFQQTTSPVTAKGIEDTAFYIYNRLLSLNEVGGDPEQFGVDLKTFHDRMGERQARWPHALSATATHDTKRGEDVRARINVLSEMPRAWQRALTNWAKLNKEKKRQVEEKPSPDRNEEYFLYQTLIGAWAFGPLDDAEYRTFCDRIQAYMLKAVREAKVHTSWVSPNHAYEEAIRDFIETLLDRTRPNRFLEAFLPFQERIAQIGIYSSLSQLVIKIAAPGIPDFYQGSELWDLSLVDPDNRRPVDFPLRARLLEDLHGSDDPRGTVEELVKSRADGRIKLYVTAVGLRYRRANAPLFQKGAYLPIEGLGEKKEHLLSFARIGEEREVIAAVPRLVTRLLPDADLPPHGRNVWGETGLILPSGSEGVRYKNLFTEEEITPTETEGRLLLPLCEVFRSFPVALLTRTS